MSGQKEFQRRRRELMGMIGANGIAVLAAAPERVRSRDTLFIYRPDSDFYYLTGFPEPEAVAVLVPGRPQGEFLLFCRERNPERELWDGPRAGPEGAVAAFGADDGYPIDDLDDILPGLLERSDRVYYSIGKNEFDQKLLAFIQTLNSKRQSSHAPSEIVALDHLLHEMRLFKSRGEAGTMRRSARIAVAAHTRAMQAARPGMIEYELEAEFLHEFRRHGADCSYPPIVAAGANACVLHYRANNAPLRDGDLLLIDAGAEYDCYASDITRTFPVNGRYSQEQRAIYDIVLAAQAAAIDEVRPGRAFDAYHEAAVRVITRGLIRIGLLEGSLEKNLREHAYRAFYMHKTGHWLGLDVHDVGDYRIDGEFRLLEPGMVVTVEPGIYIAPELKKVPARWRGIGVRIEDDVVVTRGDPVVLTSDVPRDADAIEALMASAK